MSQHSQHEVDERTNLTNNNRFELLLFRLGESARSNQREMFGINVFKVREIMVMPPVTHVADAGAHILGAVNVRGQIIPVIDLASVIGTRNGNANILLITEYARSTQGFAVEEVDEIVRLEWSQIFPAEASVGSSNITSLARLDGNADNSRLAQVIDVEQILVDVFPARHTDLAPDNDDRPIKLPPGAKLLVADDSGLARSLIANGLEAMGAPYVMTKSGQEAWDTLQNIARDAAREGKTVRDKIALVLTDLEMPEMDGFTLTRKIKTEPAFQSIPVVIHSSLSGSANEDHVRRVGANGYVAKFEANELAQAIASALG
ncbi:chemotaxis protein [Ralstonia flatus]|uniref:Chemotaxis protein CheV n=1 Tax=Ralstonia flatus TaxID=3058601 RepID=A0AAD2BXJ1_9RALS|nr:chemotaxis protein [Ralstonia sp. LMG 32965]MBN6210523.1 chemotaxis protein CheV [Ralstonia pickettii]CAJ0868452.1 Chemotaxis protein CheV [Ralstonia sp. LMG 32965]CAJ0878620.1 Chemotaxis protein CheV [Ralstonia sp. LMG 32965]